MALNVGKTNSSGHGSKGPARPSPDAPGKNFSAGEKFDFARLGEGTWGEIVLLFPGMDFTRFGGGGPCRGGGGGGTISKKSLLNLGRGRAKGKKSSGFEKPINPRVAGSTI